MRKSSYYANKAMGRCVCCGKNKADEGYATCLVCRMDIRAKGDTHSDEYKVKHAKWLKDRRAWQKDNGICQACGTRPIKKNRSLCERCLLKAKERSLAKRRANENIVPRELMDGAIRCAICGALKDNNGHKVCNDCYPKYKQLMLNARSKRDTKNNPNWFEKITRCTKVGNRQ